jgi:hypothetical protein
LPGPQKGFLYDVFDRVAVPAQKACDIAVEAVVLGQTALDGCGPAGVVFVDVATSQG